MSKGAVTALATLAVAAVAAAPASAAQSRAEYVAQADPLCLAVVQQEIPALKAFNKANKQFNRANRTRRSVNRFIRKGVRFFRFVSKVETGLNTQLSAIPVPANPPSDGQAATAWLQKRVEAIGFLNRGVVALNHHRLRAFLNAINQFDSEIQDGNAMVPGWGFQYCA